MALFCLLCLVLYFVMGFVLFTGGDGLLFDLWLYILILIFQGQLSLLQEVSSIYWFILLIMLFPGSFKLP